jgi:putative ABC transport system substrate-binding protein
MDRRRFVVLIGSALAAPLAAVAQPRARAWRIGVLSLDAADALIGRQQRQFLHDALARAGYRGDGDIAIEWRFAEARVERLQSLAAGLVRLRMDAIMTLSSVETTLAAMQATRAIPIVMHYFPDDPVKRGIVASLAHPGGNVTGTLYPEPIEIVPKQYQVLKEAVPNATRVAALWNPMIPGARSGADAVGARIKGVLDIAVTDFTVSSPEEIPPALQRIAAFKPDALYVATDPVVRARLSQVIAFAIEHRLITVAGGLTAVREGALLYYGPDVPSVWDRSVSFIDRIRRGAKPADLPVEYPTKYELVVNVKTARAIGWRIPPVLQMRVDRVIE